MDELTPETSNADDKIEDGTQSFAKLSTAAEKALEENEMVNDLADFELEESDVAVSVDEDEINMELSDFKLPID